jgi:hypothetical protein
LLRSQKVLRVTAAACSEAQAEEARNDDYDDYDANDVKMFIVHSDSGI